MKQYLVQLVFGDKNSQFGKHETKHTSNYPCERIWQAYIDSCKKTGLQFDNEANRTGLKNPEDWRKIFTEVDECCISDEASEILINQGIVLEDHGMIDGDYVYFDKYLAGGLVMDFIKLSMPSDWKYRCVDYDENPPKGEYETINQVEFCRGLFC